MSSRIAADGPSGVRLGAAASPRGQRAPVRVGGGLSAAAGWIGGGFGGLVRLGAVWMAIGFG